MRFLDYLFYRVALYYNEKRDRQDADRFGFYAVWFFLAIGFDDLFFLFVLVAGPKYERYWKGYAIGMTLLIFPLCLIRYGARRFQQLETRWAEEDCVSRRGGTVRLSLACIIVATGLVAYIVYMRLVYGS